MKFALILALASSASAWTFVSEEWPNVKNWAKKPVSKLYDLTAEQNNALESIPKIDVTLEVPRVECPTDATPEKYGKAGSCWWSCQTEGPKCLRDTDISVCKKDHYGLIFADGVTEHTAKILDLLKARNHKATFCLIGARLVQQQALAKRIVDEGHDLCMHTWSHWPMTNMDSKTVMSDILWTAKAFKDVLGVEPSLILPPHGSLDDRVREIIKTLGYTALMWNFSVKDTRLAAKNKVTGDELLDRKYADIATIKDDFTASYQKEYPNGIISLHHDSFEESLEYATFVLDTIVPKYKVVPVSECLGRSVWKSAPGELPVPDSNPSTSSSTPPNPNAVEQTGSAPITAASGLLAAIASASTVSMMV